MPRTAFHPLVARWFAERFAAPTPPQTAGWAAIAEGRDALIAAPTGSGKTLAAFLWAINALVTEATSGRLADETAVIYVSPLKALGNDIQVNLAGPLAEIRALAEQAGTTLPEIRVAVRSGDTPAAERARMTRRPPHILITTPESLYILLTAEGSRRFLRTARTVIVDEIHAVAPDKRGAHLALSLERLDLLAGRRLQRIGLSATVKPVEEIAHLLAGAGCDEVDARASRAPVTGHAGGDDATGPGCAIVDTGHRRPWDLRVEAPGPPRGPIATHETWEAVYDRVAALVREHRTTLVFVHTRRLVERVAHHLALRLGADKVAAHHGSLSRRLRLDAERRLKTGEVPVVVATASLELGIDIGHVDLVCHLGAPRSIATLLQRVGRAGHTFGGISRGVLFPVTRDDLLQAAAVVRAARAGDLDALVQSDCPLDVLAQQIVATAATGEIAEDELFAVVRRAHPYRSLARTEFDRIVEMLSEGIARRWGRTTAYLHRDGTRRTVRGRRGARLLAITSGGAIPDTADYDVVLDPEGTVVGSVNEDFAIESMAGDVFLLGNASWRIRRVEAGRVRVEDARGAPPSVPFWLGEAPARTPELSRAVAALREEIAGRLADPAGAGAWLEAATGVDAEGAQQLVAYIDETRAALGCVPTQERVVAERFFDEAGGMQLVLHTPFGGRVNRAWGFALRKRFCLTFDFELQAAATDDGVVLSLGPQHSFPLESVFAFVRRPSLRDDATQAVLASPLFTTRWRWNAVRSLALARRQGGRRVPMPIQRMRAEDLLAAVFPDQVACQDNHAGPIAVPDHPLVAETVRNCLEEAMDVPGLDAILERIESGAIRTVAVETPSPSPISQEILNANPFAFLDDAPLEERRARAIALRRTDPALAAGPGVLDAGAIAEVSAQARPDVRTADDLHDHLLTVGLLPAGAAPEWEPFARDLCEAGRAAAVVWRDDAGGERRAYAATERLAEVRAAVSGGEAPGPFPSDATREIVHGWIQCSGPITADGLASRLGLRAPAVEQALAALEGAGVVLRGRFTPGTEREEWCDRRLLSRIHRLTLGRLRREIEAVPPAVFVRYLLRWQHVQPGTQLHGRDGLYEIIGMLQGFELPAPGWEEHVLPARVRHYDPGDLDSMCLAGTVTWGRLNADGEDGGTEEPPAGPGRGRRRRHGATTRAVPIALLLREDLPAFAGHAAAAPAESRPESGPDGRPAAGTRPSGLRGAAADVYAYLERHGASFLTDIARGIGRLPADAESALWNLVALGLVSGDGFAGLRHLLTRAERERTRRRALRLAGGRAMKRTLPAGRWALWRPQAADRDDPVEQRDEVHAHQLLRRYGVVFRDLLIRERCAPPWRRLLDLYRRWEAQGRIRGGRFVAGFVGEQFALPEAVEALRAVRREPDETHDVVISATDPLNLVGIVLPGARLSPLSGFGIALRNGAAVDVGPYGALLARRGLRGHLQVESAGLPPTGG